MGDAELAGNVARTNSLLRQIDDSLTDDVWERSTVDKDAAQLVHAPMPFRVAVVRVRTDVVRPDMMGSHVAVVLGSRHSERARMTPAHRVAVHQQRVHLGHHPSASYIERHCFVCFGSFFLRRGYKLEGVRKVVVCFFF